MKTISLAGLVLVTSVSFAGAQAQTPTKHPSPSPEQRSRTTTPPSVPRSIPEPKSELESDDNEATTPQGVVVGTKPDSQPEAAGPAATERHSEPLAASVRILSPSQIQSRIAEAERLLKSRPLQTAKNSPSIDQVTLAALDRNTSRIHLLTIYKEVFLAKGSEITAPSSLGTNLSVRVLRANGVNTAVAVFDSQGRSLVP